VNGVTMLVKLFRSRTGDYLKKQVDVVGRVATMLQCRANITRMSYKDEMQVLDMLARKHFGEFGFMTCTEEEMITILNKYMTNEESN